MLYRKNGKKNHLKRINKTALVVLLLLQVSCVIFVPINTARSKVTSQNHDPILFLHGYMGVEIDWHTMKELFIADGWSETTLFAYTFPDRNNCTIEANIDNANEIKKWVENILTETGTEKVDLVGYGMGGLSSRYYIKFLGGIDTVDDYVSLGSPHHGGKILTCPILTSLNEGDETPGGILNDTNEEDHIPGNISYTSIYGDSDELVPVFSSKLDGANNILIKGLRKPPLLTNETVYELVRAAVNGVIPKGSNIGYDSLIMPTVVIIISFLAIKKRQKR